ncbi:MAG: hypothetical protein ACOYXW_01365 [Actinomycetota bacterium]
MATVSLTVRDFEDTVLGRDGVLVHVQPGALPAPALEELIQAVRGLDMDAVRRQIAERTAAAGQGA